VQDFDTTDRRLIAELKLDGRASVTRLASLLEISRATVQARLDRLIRSGVIKRFTVELDAVAEESRIHAVMLIEIRGALARAVTRALKRMPEIVDLHTTNGAWDLVARVETASLPSFDRVLREVREIQGVLNSETCLLLDTAKP
jgi:DNA-binding Lrp family transcriptional regulator